jgi:hypothetical protein
VTNHDRMRAPTLRRTAVTAIAAVLCCAAVGPGVQSATAAQGPPALMLPYGGGWSGGIDRGNGSQLQAESYLPADYLTGQKFIQYARDRGVPPEKVRMYQQLRIFGHYIPPASGLGPINDDPKRPYFNNSMMRVIGIKSSVRFSDVTDEAAQNLLPWALEALRKQNALAEQGKNTQTRQARCWELGVPNFNEVPQPLYFIQTPAEIVMYMGHRVRHIYMNVPHAKNLQPTWYGESVGRYEGDTLVVDTIGQNDKTFVDGYRTPHTTQLHVVERYRVSNGGNGLDTTFTVDDPGTFKKPWSARRPRYRLDDHPLNDVDRICAAGNEDKFNSGLDPLQSAKTPDF